MRKSVAILAALCCMSTLAFAQGGKLGPSLEQPADPPGSELLVIPSGSPLRLASVVLEPEGEAKFHGRFTVSGTFELEGHGENAAVTLWPDQKSQAVLPNWKDRSPPEEISISNAWAFAQAVVPKDQLRKLKTERLPSVRGRVTIIADEYQTSVSCDVASYSARFVSLVKPVKMAAKPERAETC